MIKLETKTRRAVFRGAFAACYLAALAALFVTGRGHILLIDNAASGTSADAAANAPADAAASAVDGGIPAFRNVKVSVNGEPAVIFGAGDRDRFFVSGTRTRIRIEAGKGETSPALPFEAAVRLPLRPDALLLSLPRLAAGADNALEVFTAAPPAAPPAAQDAARDAARDAAEDGNAAGDAGGAP